MATLKLDIGGERYEIACRDGEEPHLEALATLVDEKAQSAMKAVGRTSGERRLLLAALLLADELGDARTALAAAEAARAAPPPADPGMALAIENLAERAEQLVARLEKRGTSA